MAAPGAARGSGEWLGVGQWLASERGVGPVFRCRLEKALAIMRRVGCLPTFNMREVALGTLANFLVVYKVEPANVEAAA